MGITAKAYTTLFAAVYSTLH